ncbi:sugar phosphate isomerase/epimerase family protein [Desertimonas flava]|uniref:sugar phosphate isomerase/epimerase family protein n=1 Tax=Desertimonas flava TaxID=2064846 RepID=UPI000E34B139|nr:sugar phosphate isomerase/epimerase [Desertimonas flava]
MVRRSAYQLGPDDLVLSHFSLGRQHPIDERIRLAAANGFAGIGLYTGHYRALEESGDAPGRLRELLDEHELVLAEIEVVPGLGADGAGGGAAAEVEAIAWRMADEFGSRYLQCIGPSGRSVADAGRAFGALCDRAADHGLVVGLEFLPFTDVVTVGDARAIVEAADRPNGGVCVDIWHHERGANDLGAIRDLPAELIMGVQMSDGPRRPVDPDYYTDCLRNRLAPGDGEFDVAGFVGALREAGSTVSWSLEVCSAAGWADPAPHVRRIADGMRAALHASALPPN